MAFGYLLFRKLSWRLWRYTSSELTIARLKILHWFSFLRFSSESGCKWKYIKISCNFRMIIMKLNCIFTPLLFFVLCEVELKNTLSLYLCLNRDISWINSFLFTWKCRKWTFSFWTKICIFCNKPHILLRILIKVLKIMLSL